MQMTLLFGVFSHVQYAKLQMWEKYFGINSITEYVYEISFTEMFYSLLFYFVFLFFFREFLI